MRLPGPKHCSICGTITSHNYKDQKIDCGNNLHLHIRVSDVMMSSIDLVNVVVCRSCIAQGILDSYELD